MMRQIFKFGLVGAFMLMSSLTFAQISGKVKDASTGNALIGASVYLEGDTRGTSTNIDGTFELPNKPDGNLVVSFIGYETLTLLIVTGKHLLQ